MGLRFGRFDKEKVWHNNLSVWDCKKTDNGTAIFVDGERLEDSVRAT
jgi:hypothetical protein